MLSRDLTGSLPCCAFQFAKSLSAPFAGSGSRPQGDAKVPRLKVECFGGLFQEMSLRHLLNLPTQTGFLWRAKKDTMEVATGRTCPIFEWSEIALHTREYVPKKFWQVSVDDRPFDSDPINKHAHVQSKAVFSNAMTVMDNVHGWEGEEKWVGSKFAACMWICPKSVLCGGRQESTQEYLKRWMLASFRRT